MGNYTKQLIIWSNTSNDMGVQISENPMFCFVFAQIVLAALLHRVNTELLTQRLRENLFPY
jgi:hypothetical protein